MNAHRSSRAHGIIGVRWLALLALLCGQLLPLAQVQAVARLPQPIAAPAPAPAVAAAPLAAQITATKRDALLTDVGNDGKASPGDTLHYTVQVTNTGTSTATGVVVSDTIDAATTLSGTINVSPLAGDDDYTAVGNTLLAVGVAVAANTPAVQVAGSLFDNDREFGGDAFSLASFDATSTSGGAVAVNADGTFTYLPPVGFIGSDSFTYTISDGTLTGVGTVKITVSNRVWYVDTAAPAGGDGRSATPFNSVAPVNNSASDADGSNDTLFLNTGAGAYMPLTLENGQQLIGRGVDLIVGGVTLLTAGSFPTLAGGSATGVTLAQNDTIRGLNITAASGGTGISGTSFGTLTVDSTRINGGGMLNLSTGTVMATFLDLGSTGTSGNGISLTNVNGSLSVAAGSIVNVAGTAVLIDGGTVAVAYLGTIANSAARSIVVQNHTTGAITFGGAISDTGTGMLIQNNSSGTITFAGTSKTVTTDANPAVTLMNNTGATVSFTNGGLNITTTSGTGFSASGGGTVTVTGSANTVSSGSGTAISIANTTIGAAGVTFQSVSANGGARGITLNNAGSGGFTVTGSGSTDGSGGTIQNISQRGIEIIGTNTISLANMTLNNANTSNGASCDGLSSVNCNAALYLNNVSVVVLNNVDIANAAQQGINGVAVTNFSMTGGLLQNNGNEANEGGVRFVGLGGTSRFDGVDVTGSAERNVWIANAAGALTLTVVNSTFRDTQSSALGADGLEVDFTGTAQGTVNVANSQFLRNKTNGMQVIAENTAVATVNIITSTFDPGSGVGIGIDLAANNSAQLNFNVIGNPLIKSNGGPAVNVFGAVSARIEGRINDNPDIRVGGAGTSGFGIRVNMNDQSTAVVEISNNTVSDIGFDAGIQVISRGDTSPSPSGRIDATIRNNRVTIVEEFGLYSYWVQANDKNSVCANVGNNQSTITPGSIAHFRERTNAATATVLLQGWTGTVAGTWSANGNTPASPVSVSNFGTVGGGTCATPANPLPGVIALAVPPTLAVAVAPPIQAVAQPGHASVVSMLGRAATTTTPSVAPRPRAQASSFPIMLGDLPPGKALTIVFDVLINAPTPAGKEFIANQAQISGANVATAVSDDPDTAAPGDPTLTTLDAAPDLVLGKDDGGISAVPGDVIAYTLRYTNTGDQNASGVVLSETVPANTTFNAGASSAGWTCAPNNNAGATCTLAVGGVAVNGTGSAVFAVTVVDPIPAGVTQISNTASIADDGTSGTDTTPANNSASDTTPVIAQPDLTISKTSVGGPTAPGQTVVFTLSYTNTGNQGATGVTLSETVPANASFNTGASSAGWSCTPDASAGSTCTLTIGALGGGASGTRNFAVTIAAPFPVGVDQIDNTATIADDGANGADPSPANNTSSATALVDARADLVISKSDGGVTRQPGQTVLYTLAYSSTGTRDASSVVITETVPLNTTFDSANSSAGWSCADGAAAGTICTVTVGALPSGSSGSTNFAARIANPFAAGVTQISNTASIGDDGSGGTDRNPADNVASDTTPIDAAPDLTLSKSDGGVSAVPGDVITYTLTITNVGNQDATGVVLTETVPLNSSFDAANSSAGWACTPDSSASSTCTLTIGALGGGASVNKTFAVTVANPVPAGVTQIGNTASVADDGANGADATPGDNSASILTPLDAAPDMELAKRDAGPVWAGATITYTLTYTNAGNQDATGVVLTETVPANTTFNAGASSAVWACAPDSSAGSSCTLAIGNVAAGTGSSVTFAVDTDVLFPVGVKQVNNSASIADDGTNGADPTPGDNSASIATDVLLEADLQISKTASATAARPGQPLTYTLTFTNAGPQIAAEVVITDLLPLALENVQVGSSRTITDTGATPSVWQIGTLGVNESGTITVSGTLSTTLAADATLTNTASIAGAVIDPVPANDRADAVVSVAVPRVEWSSAAVSVAEDAGTATLTVTLDAPNPFADASVQYASSDGTATAGADYAATSGTLTIPAGSTSAMISVVISDDALAEADETLQFSLSNPAGAALGTPATVTLTIVDDDSSDVRIAPTNISVAEGGATATYGVALASQPTNDVTIALTNDGQVTATPQTLRFTPNTWNITQTVTVAAVDDSVVEGPHTSVISHAASSTDPRYNAISVAAVTVSIADNDSGDSTPGSSTVYLPLIVKRPAAAPAPDLVVDSIVTSASGIAVTIRNAGDAPVVDTFWLDLYLDPQPVPTKVNQVWPQLGTSGAAWGVTSVALPLAPGATLTLTLGDRFYRADRSRLPPSVAAGTRLYAQVDSINLNTTYGGVQEGHERDGGAYNNISGPVTVASPITLTGVPSVAPAQTVALPRR